MSSPNRNGIGERGLVAKCSCVTRKRIHRHCCASFRTRRGRGVVWGDHASMMFTTGVKWEPAIRRERERACSPQNSKLRPFQCLPVSSDSRTRKVVAGQAVAKAAVPRRHLGASASAGLRSHASNGPRRPPRGPLMLASATARCSGWSWSRSSGARRAICETPAGVGVAALGRESGTPVQRAMRSLTSRAAPVRSVGTLQ